MSIENTLFLGNGFSRSIFSNIPSWGSLFDTDTDKDKESTNINNYTILYEKYFLSSNNKDTDESKFKKDL